MNEPMIKVENLSKRYSIGTKEAYYSLRDQITSILSFAKPREKNKDFWALKDINFEVKKGESLGIIGRNGAGKSTLLKILSRITPPTTGKITMRGRVASLLEVGTGFHPELTGRENIFLNGAILGMSRKEIQSKFKQIVDFAEIENFLDTPVKRYSSGMYVRLAFAVAAHLEPEILVIDEVLAVGDAQFQKKCLGKMKEVGKQGRTILFVSHNMAAVRSLCRRALLIEDGRIAKIGPTSEIIDLYAGDTGADVLSKEWKDTNSAPQNHSAILEKIIITDKNGKKMRELGTDNPFNVEIIYKVKNQESAVGMTISLYDSQDNCIFCSINNHEKKWYGKSMPQGRYKSVCKIPGQLFNNGWFYVSINLFGKGFSDAVMTNNVLRFHIFDRPKVRGDYYGEYAGVFRPLLDWKTDKIN